MSLIPLIIVACYQFYQLLIFQCHAQAVSTGWVMFRGQKPGKGRRSALACSEWSVLELTGRILVCVRETENETYKINIRC